ncbi:MAG: hypothetical protein WBL64_09205 [Nitrososphaeraceae archaeon]
MKITDTIPNTALIAGIQISITTFSAENIILSNLECHLVTNPSFTVAPGYDPIIARSSKNTYRDLGFEWDSSGKNGFYSKLKYGP